VYSDLGQYAKAEPPFERALAIREKVLGSKHPDVATCLENYVLLLRNMGRTEEAAPFESRARVIHEKHS
jgi:tetratricopeptide (TPR) repeat protein